jgi:hypothetical protein
MKASIVPISSETSFINDLYCANSLIHAGVYLPVSPISVSNTPLALCALARQTYSFPLTLSLTYARSRYSKLTMML